MSKNGIYKITNTTNSKAYVGQSSDIKVRFKSHISDLKRGAHSNRYLQNSWSKHGEEAFEFEILELCTKDKTSEREIYWIKKLNTFNDGYNLTEGGEGATGYEFTEADRIKMSKAQEGNQKWLGKKHSKESRAKIAESNRRRTLSEETKRKISEGNKGKKATDETRKKLSISHKGLFSGEKNPMYGADRKGEKNPMYGRIGGKSPSAKKVYCDGTVFECVKDCAIYYNIGYSSMRSYLNGQRKMPTRFKEMKLHYTI